MTAAPAKPPSADVAVRVVMRNAHRQNAALSVAVPDEDGLFAPALLPEVFPVVVDAKALRDDLLRVAAGRPRTLMLNAATSGVLRLSVRPTSGLFQGVTVARRVSWPWLVVVAVAAVGTANELDGLVAVELVDTYRRSLRGHPSP